MPENITVDTKLSLSSPWVEHFHKLLALFGEDPDIKIVYDGGDSPVVKLFVDNPDKASCIQQLLPETVSFGNVDLRIDVIPSNDERSIANAILGAFAGNPVFVDVDTVSTLLSDATTYVTFENAVVQYFNDDISDPYGVTSTLYEDIARDVLKELPAVFYCTEIGDEQIFIE